MHYASHIFLYCIALWCVINDGKAARTAVSPDILTNFAKNVASVLSPVILRDVQSRNNRSSFQSTLSVSANLNDDLNLHSILNNIVDPKTSNAATYYGPRSYPYNKLYEDSPEELEGSETNERFDGSRRDGSYLRQEQSNFYKPYDLSTGNDNLDATRKSSDNVDSSIGRIQESSTNLYPSYHGSGFPKAAFPHGPFLDKPYGGFYGGFGPYGHHHHHHHHHHPYGDGSSEEAGTEENARLGNRTNYGDYGSSYGGYGHHHPYSPFPYDGYGHHDFYGPYQRNGNDSSRNGHYGHHGYGPYGGPDFYGHGGYNHGDYGYGNNNDNNNGNNNNNNNRQTEEPAENGDQNNSTKNGYSPPYGPPWVKPLLGIFHPHDFPLLPYDHFHGFKGGPVVGVGHVGYPIYADPYLVGFPFHHPYGPFIHGKKYLPPKGKPADSGESAETTEAPAELMENEAPERITALHDEEVAPAPSSNRYKTTPTGRKELKQFKLVNFEIRRV
ncbi:PREDICTED: probable serine/threonine-protein kinase clkA [Trachymyrmex septentrionalis]|uniref:probable serine/threonine-protein kinase clkA n=1 Tax=Trachymyrmex septentrionalis TaxID=34720 RepID=UPI00084F6D4E|nr:PREDICTED: probable serine/threonine-protein kinase clkA [Trachymyrmex septentrionalis]